MGAAVVLLLLPPTSTGTMAVLMLTPLFVILICAARWLFGNKGVAAATALSLLFSIFLFLHSLVSWFSGG